MESQKVSSEDKLRILESWQQQLIQKQQATDESMQPSDSIVSNVGGELQQVTDAINTIK